MKKLWEESKSILFLFLGWLTVLVVISLSAARTDIIPSFPYYQTDLIQYPQAAAVAAHFDGIHYMRIARYGYQDTGTQAFFPLYPILIRAATPIAGSQLAAGIIISLLSLTIAVAGVRKLFGRSAPAAVLVLLTFPVSFYFGAVYTESIFLAISVWFFVSLRNKQWYAAALLSAMAAGTRPVGIFLAAALIVELYRKKEYKHIMPAAAIGAAGLVLYMVYLRSAFGDALMFFHVQPLFGAERSGSDIVLLPVVLYRYVRMLMTVDTHTFLYLRVVLELSVFVGALWAAMRNIRRVTAAQSIFVLSSLILPTVTGTLSSMPRYAAVLLLWLLPPELKVSRTLIGWSVVSTALLLYLFSMFANGTFVA